MYGLVQGEEGEWNVRIGTEKTGICEDMENSIDWISLQVDQVYYYYWPCYNLRFCDVLSHWSTRKYNTTLLGDWVHWDSDKSSSGHTWPSLVPWCSCRAVGSAGWAEVQLPGSAEPRGSGRAVLVLGREKQSLGLLPGLTSHGKQRTELESVWGWQIGSVSFPPLLSLEELFSIIMDT